MVINRGREKREIENITRIETMKRIENIKRIENVKRMIHPRCVRLLRDSWYLRTLRRYIDIGAIGLLRQGFLWLLLGYLFFNPLPYAL